MSMSCGNILVVGMVFYMSDSKMCTGNEPMAVIFTIAIPSRESLESGFFPRISNYLLQGIGT